MEMNHGFFRIAVASPAVAVADVESNVENICALMRQAWQKGAALTVFPELCVTAYTCGDLFHSSLLLEAAQKGLDRIAGISGELPGTAFVVGVPVRCGSRLLNCAAVVSGGKVAGYVPKTYIPEYNEFYEKRWFSSGAGIESCIGEVPLGGNLLFRIGGVTFGTEICEDLWTPAPPSSTLSLSGAEVMVNLSASDDVIGKYSYLRNLIATQSARSICAYAYASAGFGESSTDLVFDAKLFIAENGRILSHNDRWIRGNQMQIADVDVEALRRDRMHTGSFSDCARDKSEPVRIIDLGDAAMPSSGLLRAVEPHPFVPAASEPLREIGSSSNGRSA